MAACVCEVCECSRAAAYERDRSDSNRRGRRGVLSVQSDVNETDVVCDQLTEPDGRDLHTPACLSAEHALHGHAARRRCLAHQRGHPEPRRRVDGSQLPVVVYDWGAEPSDQASPSCSTQNPSRAGAGRKAVQLCMHLCQQACRHSSVHLCRRPSWLRSATELLSIRAVTLQRGWSLYRSGTRLVQKARLLGISERGNRYLRKILIQGARAAVLGLKRERAPMGWMTALEARAPRNVLIVANANELARIAWAGVVER